jgi:hypothetical protein
MWAVATFAWFVSSTKLTQAITFPIMTRVSIVCLLLPHCLSVQLPGTIASLWGVFYFKEVRVGTVLLWYYCSDKINRAPAIWP